MQEHNNYNNFNRIETIRQQNDQNAYSQKCFSNRRIINDNQQDVLEAIKSINDLILKHKSSNKAILLTDRFSYIKAFFRFIKSKLKVKY